MSKVGKKPIVIPKGVTVTFDNSAKAPHFSAGMSAASPKAKLSKRQKEEAANFSRRSLPKEGSALTVRGPAGERSLRIPSLIKVDVSEGQLRVVPRQNSRRARQLWGVTRSLLQNAVRGVKEPFRKELEFEGLGYRVQKKGSDLVFQLGFSHPVEYHAPEGVKLEVVDKSRIAVSGVDKQLVGQTAAEIRNLRPPEPYKGKGLRYVGEKIKKKPGKAAKVGAGLGAEGG